MSNALYAYRCPRCGRHLLDAPRGASVSCPDCKIWAQAQPVRGTSAGHPPDTSGGSQQNC